MNIRPFLACYYFPNYHKDPRNDVNFGPGWTEWELVKRAEPKFRGHRQPLVPAWGYEDESRPAVMARKIAAASNHGIDAFIFDWYWYQHKPYLHRALENGFMKARNNKRMKFAVMWANHDWTDVFPGRLNSAPPVLFPAALTAVGFNAMCDYIIERYFKHPCYWTIDGCPYFSIFELHKLIENFDSIAGARRALRRFRKKVKKAGFRDLHLNFVVWGIRMLSGTRSVRNPSEICTYLECDSVTSYSLVHNIPMQDFPKSDYKHIVSGAPAYWRKAAGEFPVPVHPNVTMGWDSSPRCIQSNTYVQNGYPYCPILVGNTPTAFQKLLKAAKRYLETLPPDGRICTINAWNEWSEGSYLEPDTVHGMEYLRTIKRSFGISG